MTSKIYRSAQGKSVDLGVLMLQNEHVRAVGNMKVNARGDKINNLNQVVETKPQQIQRRNDQTTTNVSDQPVYTSAAAARRAMQADNTVQPDIIEDPTIDDPVDFEQPEVAAPVAPDTDPVVAQAQSVTPDPVVPKGAGLAGAIARTRTIKQELDRSRRQQAQDSGVKKI